MGIFKREDLEKLRDILEKRKEKIETFRKYSFLSTGNALKLLKEDLEILEALLVNSKETSKFLGSLNTGKYKFSEGKVYFVLDEYYLKPRVVLSLSRTKLQSNANYDSIVGKLIHFKIKESYNIEVPNRDKIIGGIVRYIKKNLNSEVYYLNGDFKSYTLNIPRKQLIFSLKRQNFPDILISLIENFLNIQNQYSRILTKYNVSKFFRKLNMEDKFLKDAEFKSLVKFDGILPGTTISNLLGQLFLKDFDKKIENELNGKGVYFRYFDDFIVISTDPRIISKVRKNIISFIVEQYKNKDIVQILKLDNKPELLKNQPFDFLGYSFYRKSSEKIKVSIRYKTIKKFLLKYLCTYSYRNSRFYKERDIESYLRAKVFYLYNWVKSFKFINDYELLDFLYIKFVVPDLINLFLAEGYDIETARKKVKDIRHYFKLTLIHRLLKKTFKIEDSFLRILDSVRFFV